VQKVSAAAVETGGTVNLVNPLELQRQMRTILDNPPIGYNVSVDLQLHSSLGFITHYNQQDKKSLKHIQTVHPSPASCIFLPSTNFLLFIFVG
jgi:hypothetical protein